MKKTFLLIHKWLGIVFGVFICIACFTGAILVFRSELCQLFGVEMRDAEFFRWVMRLHRWLLDAPSNPHGGLSVGRVIMGISAIACTLILITGVVVWWPKNLKMLRARLSVKVHSGWMRFVHDTHVSLGIYAVIFLLLMSLTGPVWSFQWYRSGATAVICAEQPSGEVKPDDREQSGGARHESKGNQAVKPEAGHGHGHSQQVSGGKNSAQKTFLSLHMGTWGGTVARIIYLLAALIGGFLPISGYYIWLKKRALKRSGKMPPHH